ncbi:hypothetical protein HAPAU_20510 [Halalkalicoccus paucihalophilus]|uniref:Rpa-associated protein n=1 Tax=Halalkalicoccus paucihalophilus TaxID=1008153 RepID=A0A151ACF6_9EURY|nr:hypothetical protein [Halalkalicoccus paucihalophilus]KYH25381.1 hypothetical protein HAPAU_20510 [Halalkalicoccus paucihalophilus]
MSDSEGASGGDSGPGTREIAHRLFATEFDAASLEYADSDEERAPKYVITPTGARVNRLFVVGVLTEVERVNDDVVRARVVDPTGAFVVYAGQYQPDALAFLERAEPPTFVAVTGKANTFQPEDSERVYTSVRPESIAEVDAETRDRWTVQAAAHTLGRIGEFAGALGGGESDPTGGIGLAREEYGTTPAYLASLRDTALDAARLVAGEVEEVAAPAIDPDGDDGRAVDLADLQDRKAAASEPSADEPSTATNGPSGPDPTTEHSGDTATESQFDSDIDGSEPADTGSTELDPEVETGETGSTETTSDESEPEDEAKTDDLGDFSVAETDSDSETDAESVPEADSEPDVAVADEDDLYEFDPEERAEIESEFDMDFASGNEVEEPGEADIDTPEPAPEEVAEPGADSELDSGAEAEEPEATAAAAEPTDAEPDDADGTPASDDGEADIEDRAMTVMKELAEGDGADREEVIERVASEAGVAPEEVDEAIESALLSGRCYEPQDDVLKPI